MNEQAIVSRLFEMRDEAYGALQVKLIPTAPKDSFIGVRTPALRKLAREVKQEGKERDFPAVLPHAYFEENGLHAALLCLVSALYYPSFLLITAAAGFMCLIVRVVKNVFQQAIAMKSELDLTI